MPPPHHATEIYKLFSRKNINAGGGEGGAGGAGGGGSALHTGDTLVVTADEPEKRAGGGCCK